MNRTPTLLFAFCVLSGCSQAPVDDRGASGGTASPAVVAVVPAPPVSITNRFGMTFRLVSIEPRPEGVSEIGKYGVAFPKESYYLGQTEVTSEHLEAIRRAAAERDRSLPADQRKLHSLPGEWIVAHNLGVELSALDPDYEYNLPTREQWAFACLNGYDQDCPHRESQGPPLTAKRPNKFGIDGFLNYDIGCGNLPGLHFGLARLTSQTNEPECCCVDYAFGNPDGDDGLNELITCRYVLKPRAKR